MLLIMGSQTEALEPSISGVVFSLLHQSATVALAPLRPGHNYRLDKKAAAATHDPGQPGVAEQPLCPSAALQENQVDGKL